MQRQLELDLGLPKDYEALYKRLGIDPKAEERRRACLDWEKTACLYSFPRFTKASSHLTAFT